jgi:hypothetical protein
MKVELPSGSTMVSSCCHISDGCNALSDVIRKPNKALRADAEDRAAQEQRYSLSYHKTDTSVNRKMKGIVAR